jgi:peptidoglycan hydrolase CwlO-like protein
MGTNVNGSFGIEQALALFKQFSSAGDDPKVIDIVKKTLASTGISIPALLDEAASQQDEVTGEIMRIQGEVASLNQRIESLTMTVGDLQEQLAEIGSLRERLEE